MYLDERNAVFGFFLTQLICLRSRYGVRFFQCFLESSPLLEPQKLGSIPDRIDSSNDKISFVGEVFDKKWLAPYR